MTIEITEFRCPTCGHVLGEEQYIGACQQVNRFVDERSNELNAIKEEQHRKEIQQLREQHRKEIQHRDQFMELEIKSKVQQSLSEERTKIETRHQQTLAEKDRQLEEKDRQIEDANFGVNEKIVYAIREIEAKHALREKQKEKEFQIRFERVKAKNEELQKIVDNIPPELQGTAGEFVLLDELARAFPRDDIQSKKPGKEMADVIQTIVTEAGEKVFPPIVYDVKTGDTVTPADIEKAKRYKDIHNTDCSIIVTAKGIRPKDCESRDSTLIGKRDGILLLHPSVVVGIATVMRNSILGNTKQIRVKNGTESKYRKVYDYITSPERFRKIEQKVQIKSKLDEIQQNEEDYHQRKWKERKKAIRTWFEMDMDDQMKIDEITQEEPGVGDNVE